MKTNKEAKMVIGKKSSKQKVKSVLSNWQLYVMVLPAVIYLLIFAYKPMYGLIIAFKNFKFKLGIVGSDWAGLENFERLVTSYWFPIILKNTLTISLLGLVLGFPIPIIFALLVNELKGKKIGNLVKTVSYAPHFISTIVMCGLVMLVLNPDTGIVNIFLEKLGFESYYFMQKPEAFKWIYVLSGIWQNMGWSAIIYIAALAGVDMALVEAAQIDGASRFQRMVHVYFPALVPTITILLIMEFGSIMGVGHEKVYALQNSANLNASEVISTYVYKMGLVKRDFSFATAAGLLNSVVNTITLVTVNRISKKVSNSGLW